MIAQTTKGNSEPTTAANGMEIEEQQATTAIDWKQILELQDASAKIQSSNRHNGFFYRFAARLGEIYDGITGPAATDQERRQASIVMASTRSNSYRRF